MLYLSQQTLESLGITTDEVIHSMENLILGQSQGTVWNTPKSAIQPGDGRYMMSTLSAADHPRYLAVKSVVLNPRNPQQGLPQINGLIMLLDSETGVPQAVVDGNWITAIRTAAASALVATKMANPEAAVMAFIGCGVQAQSHLRLFSDLFPLKQIRAYGRGAKNLESLCHSASQRGLEAIQCENPKDAIEDADIIVTSVTLTEKVPPFADPHWLKTGAFVSSTDMAIPWMKQGMAVFDQIIIDDMEQEMTMDEPMVEPQLISGDIAQLVSGKIKPSDSADRKSIFIFRAVVLGDLAVAGLALDKARNNNVGQALN